MQETGFSIQIGVVFYRSFSIPQISHSGGNGGKRAAFQVKLNGSEPPPKHRQLVSIVYKPGTSLRLNFFRYFFFPILVSPTGPHAIYITISLQLLLPLWC